MKAPRVVWTEGPPPGRGHWWIAWRLDDASVVTMAVAVEPAWIYRDDPNARLQLKMIGGLAFTFLENRDRITHHATLVYPDKPKQPRKPR